MNNEVRQLMVEDEQNVFLRFRRNAVPFLDADPLAVKDEIQINFVAPIRIGSIHLRGSGAF